jgi:hypothetical protein
VEQYSRPREWYVRGGRLVPFPDDLVYALYINDAMWLYEWRAENVDHEDPLNPRGWKERFKALKWKSTS